MVLRFGQDDVENSSLLYVRVENSLLLQIMRHGVLGQKRRLKPDFGAYPFALAMRLIRRMVAASAASELRSEVSRLDLVELPDLAPRRIANGTGDVDLEFQD